MSGGGGLCEEEVVFSRLFWKLFMLSLHRLFCFCFSAENVNAGHKVPNEESLYPQQWRGNLTVYERQNRGEVCNLNIES